MISIRLDPEQKEKMRKLSQVNWSDYLLRCLDEKIREEEMKEAAKGMDELAKKSPPGWNGTDEKRRWRDRRDA